MLRPRAVSQYTTLRHHNKQHCPQDLSCKNCCPCVEQLQTQSRVLRERVDRLARENQEKEKIMVKLSRTVADLEKRKEEFDKIDDFKLKVRESIRKQLLEKRKADDFILKQRLDNAKQEKKDLQDALEELHRQAEQRDREIANHQRQIAGLQEKAAALEEESARKKKDLENAEAKLNDIKDRHQNLEKILQDKTQVINRMQNALNQTEQNFITQKIKAKNSEFEVERHQEELKVKAIEIKSLSKTAEEKSQSINHLTAEKEKLGKLVVELDSTVHSYSHLSNQLRERICISEDYALQKEIQYKQLEMDYYDTVYQRIP